MSNSDQIDNQTVFGFEKHLFEYYFGFSPSFAKNLMRPALICVKLGIFGERSYRPFINCFRRTDNACLSFFSLLTESSEMRLFASRTIRYCLILFNLGDLLQCHMSHKGAQVLFSWLHTVYVPFRMTPILRLNVGSSC